MAGQNKLAATVSDGTTLYHVMNNDQGIRESDNASSSTLVFYG
jgi:hypothetical protein